MDPSEGGVSLGDSVKCLEVLIIEDSETDAKLVVRELRRSGFDPKWDRVDTAAALRTALLCASWQLIISDSNVPGLAALEALTLAKEITPNVPFVVVSGNASEATAVVVLRHGAADFVMKDRLWRLGPVVTRVCSQEQDHQNGARRLLAAVENERRRIARSLHDQLGPLLTALSLKLESVRHQRGELDLTALADASALVEQAMRHAHDLSMELWPTVLDDLGLAAGLRWLADRHAGWSGVPVQIRGDSIAGRLPPEIEIAAFRIAQEALTNAARHAHAREMVVSVRAAPDEIEIEVRDDGSGFDLTSVRARAASQRTLGLVAMHQRAAQAGGRLEILSQRGQGTTIRACFPIREGCAT